MQPTLAHDGIEPLTEPMSVPQLTKWFKVSKDLMRTILRNTPGVQSAGTKHQVPIGRMPIAYWLANGLFKPVEPEIDDNRLK